MFLNSSSILFCKDLQAILLKALLLVVLVVRSLQSRAECLAFLTDKDKSTEKPLGVSFSSNVKLFSEIDVFTNLYLQDNLLGEGAIRLNAIHHHPIHIYAPKRGGIQSGVKQISISQLIISAGVEVRLEGELHIRKNRSELFVYFLRYE